MNGIKIIGKLCGGVIMDYEKAYKDALAKARDMMSYKEVRREDMEYLFPELAQSEDEKIRRELIAYFRNNSVSIKWSGLDVKKVIEWLEKQGQQKPLYIRFGDIPANGKSKIYCGEKEVGYENGVSVYPAFRDADGGIVLGLSLPITKTTLYTQQHLLEYDNRPCYLVSGDYIGRGSDGEPLISNINVIEKINNYRVKMGKQGKSASDTRYEVKVGNSLSVNGEPFDYEKATITQKDFAPKVEPKFREGEWLCENKVNNYAHFIQILGIVNVQGDDRYRISRDIHKGEDVVEFRFVDKYYHKFDISDAKNGDVLVNGSNIFIFHFINDTRLMGYCHINTDDGRFYDDIGKNECFCLIDAVVNPATKEQRDLLFSKMKEAGYEWDAEKKELKKIEQIFTWREEDKNFIYDTISNLTELKDRYGEGYGNVGKCIDWLETLKDKVQPKQEWSEEDEHNKRQICRILKDNGCSTKLQEKIEKWIEDRLKSLRPQNKWKPSDLPHWKKSTLPNDKTTGFNSDYFCYNGYHINYKELFKKLLKDD